MGRRSKILLTQVEKFGEEKVVIALVGNKSDHTEGKFNTDAVIEYCNSKGYENTEVSAKTGDNVEKVFRSLAEKLTTVHPKVSKK